MKAFKYHSVVKKKGVIELSEIPLPEGARVKVIILPEEESAEMIKASESSLDFWENPIDNSIWNNA